jgi:hypothetical protein
LSGGNSADGYAAVERSVVDMRLQFLWTLVLCLGCSDPPSSPFKNFGPDEDKQNSGETVSDPEPPKEPPPPSQILERSAEAHGGATAIMGVRCGRVRYRILGEIADSISGTFQFEYLFEEPDQLKQTVVAATNDSTRTDVFLWNGGEGWTWTNHQKPTALNEPPPFGKIFPLAPLQTIAVANLKRFMMRAITPKFVNHRWLYGIRAEENGRWVGNMYFDSETYLFTLFEPGQTSHGESRRETLYSDFANSHSLVIPFAATSRVDGRIVSEITVEDFEVLDKLPDSDFQPINQ